MLLPLIETENENLRHIPDHFSPSSGHFIAICYKIYQITQVLTVNLLYCMLFQPNYYRSYSQKRTKKNQYRPNRISMYVYTHIFKTFIGLPDLRISLKGMSMKMIMLLRKLSYYIVRRAKTGLSITFTLRFFFKFVSRAVCSNSYPPTY